MPPDVFLSYAREDQPIAQLLRDFLAAEGWEVWWDHEIVVGEQWGPEIEKAIDRSRAMIVLWSNHSVASSWVVKEAQLALDDGKLVPIKLGRCRVPSRFRAREMAMLIGWNGQRDHPELQQLVRGLARRVAPSRIDSVRPGYVPAFLSKSTPIGWPSVPGAAQRLHYLHFTVVMNPGRRLAWYVAYNAHGGRNMARFQRGAVATRWMADPLIAEELQPSNELFLQSGFDRGHLVAPSLVGWGTEQRAQIAGHQAFFWTNTSPQHQQVNQRSYLSVEQWERDLAARRGHLVGFAGPVLSADDEAFRGREEAPDGFVMLQTFRMPKAYWKVVAVLAGQPTRLHCTAFMVENAPVTGTSVGDPAHYSVPLDVVERTTGLVFPSVLHAAEPIPDL